MDYAKAYGIDMDSLWMEHPEHPDQLEFAKRWMKKADVYWLMHMIIETQKPGRKHWKKTPRKKYVPQTDFEDWQLQIAMESLRRKEAGK